MKKKKTLNSSIVTVVVYFIFFSVIYTINKTCILDVSQTIAYVTQKNVSQKIFSYDVNSLCKSTDS